MLMGAHNGRINEDMSCYRVILCLEALPEPAPDPAAFPAAKAVIHRIPVPKVRRQVTPWRPGPGERQDRFDKQPITERRRTAGAGFQGGEERGKFRPCLVREQQTYRHPVSSFRDLLEET